MKRIKGLVCAPFTAFAADGTVDLEKVALQAKFYKDNGICGVFACGTTGEGSSLTQEEKKALLRAWSVQRGDSFVVIAFLGGTSIPDCIDLARYAAALGLDAVAMTAPYYQKAANVKELACTLAEVAAAVPEMPFYYYHIPVLTHVSFPMIGRRFHQFGICRTGLRCVLPALASSGLQHHLHARGQEWRDGLRQVCPTGGLRTLFRPR